MKPGRLTFVNEKLLQEILQVVSDPVRLESRSNPIIETDMSHTNRPQATANNNIAKDGVPAIYCRSLTM